MTDTSEQTEGKYWMSFSVTPVQGFIEASRTVRDLAVGSLILTGMARAAIDAAGGAPVFPADAAAGSIPNTFIREYGTRQKADIGAKNAANAASAYWRSLACKVKSIVAPRFAKASPGWDGGFWDWQIENYFDFRTLVIAEANATEAVYTSLFPGRAGETQPLRRLWTVVGAALAAGKQVRKFPGNPPAGNPRHKCTLLGTLEQMGPGGDLDTQREFWNNVAGFAREGGRITAADRLCAVSLVRRFAPAAAASKDPLSTWKDRVDDTATIAVRKWVERFTTNNEGSSRWNDWMTAVEAFNAEVKKKDANQPNDSAERWLLDADVPIESLRGECPALTECDAKTLLDGLGTARRALLRETDDFTFDKPPHYLAVLIMDADKMGKKLGDAAEMSRAALESLSRRLLEFSECIEGVVTGGGGLHVFAGGDDLLALLPLGSLLSAATELRNNFTAKVGSEYTITAGASVFHYKSDLQTAIREARAAEQDAKVYRNAFGARILKRSGGAQHFVCDWETASTLEGLRDLFVNGASDRWAFRFEEARGGISDSATSDQVVSMLKHFVSRTEGGTPQQREKVAGLASEIWRKQHNFLDTRHRAMNLPVHASPGQSYPVNGLNGFADLLAGQFVAMTDAASFLARGRVS